MALRGLFSCPNLDPNQFGRGKEREGDQPRKGDREREGFRERSSTFSLEFSAIGPASSDEARSKVAPHGKDYTWVPISGSFDKLQER